ncbi:hypothetical protein bcgnr5406_57610 [Bacillus cereus]|nr:hypothetical protein BCM0075_1375 [Bacillus cereus]
MIMNNHIEGKKRILHIKNLINDRNSEQIKQSLTEHFLHLQKEYNEIGQSIRRQIKNSSTSLASPIPDAIDEVRQKVTSFAEGLNHTFKLFIVGMGNYGKSTLINALLEQEVAPVDFRPKTWKIDVYDSNLPKNQCNIINRFGKIECKSLEKTKGFIAEEEWKTSESRKKVQEQLKTLVANLKTPEEVREAKRHLEKQYLYQSDVIEVRWPIEINRLSKQFHLVDTPGLVQENLSGEMMVSIQKYYPKADGVIWILDATKIASKKSKDMMEELEESLKKVGGKTDNIIAVLNRIDIVRKNGGEDAVRSVLTDAHKIFGQYFQEFVCISAKEALKGILDKDKVLIQSSGIEQLHEAIMKKFFRNARSIQLTSKITGYKQVVQQLKEHDHVIQEYFTRLQVDQKMYIDRKTKIQKQYKKSTKKYKAELENIMKSFIKDATVRIEDHATTLFDLETDLEREKYMKDSLFCFDRLQPELEQFTNFWVKELAGMKKKLQEEVRFMEYEHINPSIIDNLFKSVSYTDSSHMHLNLDAAAVETDGIGFAAGAGIAAIGALLLGPIGLLIGGIASALGINKKIAKFFKGGSLKRKLHNAVEDHVNSVENFILEQMQTICKEDKKNILSVLNESFEFLHGTYQNSCEVSNRLIQFYKTLDIEIQYPNFKTLIMQDYKKYLLYKEVL